MTEKIESQLRRVQEYLSDKKLDFFDVRYRKDTTEALTNRNDILLNNVFFEEAGVAVRVLLNGRWGFVATNVLETDNLIKCADEAMELAKAANRVAGPRIQLADLKAESLRFVSPRRIDPFSVDLREKLGLLQQVYENSKGVKGFKQVESQLLFDRYEQLIVTSDDVRLENDVLNSSVFYRLMASENGEFQTRNFQEHPVAAGYEWIIEQDPAGAAHRVADEAYQKLRAKSGPVGKKDLILMPSHLFLTIHESVGHPTELDRVLGWEANFAGTSFVDPKDLGEMQYGSEVVNFEANNQMEGGLASTGFDEDGVPAACWDIIKRGRLENLGSTRETAPFIGQSKSFGCNRADSYRSQPINRIPNLSLKPGPDGTKLEDLIASVDDGILIDGRGSFSIDQNRVNFQFGGDFFSEIKNGKVTQPLKDVTYQSQSKPFWNSCRRVCDASHWQTYGAVNCGKGEPAQAAAMTHGSSPALFEGVEVGGALNG